jgi:hypothetical protein
MVTMMVKGLPKLGQDSFLKVSNRSVDPITVGKF